MAPHEQTEQEELYVEVELKKLPSFLQLSKEVNGIIRQASFMERYGIDWCYLIAAVLSVPVAVYLLQQGGVLTFIVATLILGSFHCIVANKVGHCNAHGALSPSKTINHMLSLFVTEFVGSYSYVMGDIVHIKGHHPHTNIIGLGDSSLWKMPMLNRFTYLFVAPFLLPLITPIVAIYQLIEGRYWSQFIKCVPIIILGLYVHVQILVSYCGFSFLGAILYINLFRNLFSLPFIHVNIFQHIGLPMFSNENRPKRIYQMSNGVLNLTHCKILEHVFGHSLIDCHIEHHMFPRISDHMCKKVQPVVRSYLLNNDLPYNEDKYMNRLSIFWDRYDTLMVNAPPITHFVGLQ